MNRPPAGGALGSSEATKEDRLVQSGRIADQVDELLDGALKDQVGLEVLGSHYFRWLAVSPGSRTRYCDGGYSSPCFVQFNGVGNSLYQDIAIRGEGYVRHPDGRWRTMWGQGRFRNRSGLPGRTVQVIVWNLNDNSIAARQICNLPTGTSWVHCTTPGFQAINQMMRVEYYNSTGTNVDLDIASWDRGVR